MARVIAGIPMAQERSMAGTDGNVDRLFGGAVRYHLLT